MISECKNSCFVLISKSKMPADGREMHWKCRKDGRKKKGSFENDICSLRNRWLILASLQGFLRCFRCRSAVFSPAFSAVIFTRWAPSGTKSGGRGTFSHEVTLYIRYFCFVLSPFSTTFAVSSFSPFMRRRRNASRCGRTTTEKTTTQAII